MLLSTYNTSLLTVTQSQANQTISIDTSHHHIKEELAYAIQMLHLISRNVLMILVLEGQVAKKLLHFDLSIPHIDIFPNISHITAN